MAKWTRTPAEYDHARKMILEIPFGQSVVVTLKNGAIIKGWVAGANSGTDVGDNISAGRGPIVTSMYGEIKLQVEGGQTVLIDAVDIQHFGLAPSVENSN